MRDLFPTGQTTISQSECRSEGTSTSHSDSMSCKQKGLHMVIQIFFMLTSVDKR